MKISQYNWNWWFVLTLIIITSGFNVVMVGETENELIIGNIIVTIGFVSLIPCLYVGMKPSNDD